MGDARLRCRTQHITGDEHTPGRQYGVGLCNGLMTLETAHTRHFNITEYQVKLLAPDQLQRLGTAVHYHRLVTKLAQERGESVNTTVLALLEKATGIDGRRERILRYATWSAADVAELDEAIQVQRTVDPELWD